jgi:hypothetical protein
MDSVDYDEEQQDHADPKAPKKGGYDARVEQWLYEHPDQLVLITSAGKDGVNYIQYTINCGVRWIGTWASHRINTHTGP